MSRSAAQKSEWAKLYSDARAIDNISDKVIVTATVGSCAISAGFRSEINDFIGDLRRDLVSIPASQDRVDRYDWVAKIVRPVDKTACRTILSDAITYMANLPETYDLVKRQRSLIDIANNIDPKLAEQLIDLNDVDEARKQSLNKEKVRQENRVAFAKNPSTEEIAKMTDQELVDFCRSDLGRLNAERIGVRSIEEFEALQQRASVMPINMASDIWHLIVESSLKKRGKDKEATFALKLFDSTCKSSEIVCGLIGNFFSGEQYNKKLDVGIVRSGDRDVFIDALQLWATANNHKTIRISDPYFGPDDVHIIKCIAMQAPKAIFRVLTSKEHLKKKGIVEVGEAFEEAWQQVSDDAMPEIDLVVIGIGNSGKHPIHDRWIVSEDSGLRLGTSAHSMGGIRTSEVSSMQSSEASSACHEIDLLFDRAPREWGGERLWVTRYSL